MRKSLFLVFCLLSANLWASRVQLEIIDVERDAGSYLAFASDGQIYEIHSEEEALKAIEAKEMGVKVKLKLEKTYNTTDLLELRNTIESVKVLSEESDQKSGEYFTSNKDFSTASLMSSYVTNLDTEEQAQQLFNTMRNDTRMKSECYNRAHVWSWELHSMRYKGQRIQTGKTWLFFSKKYIRQYRYKWWFHIAPYLNVKGQTRVIDRSFSYQPLPLKEWTDMFMQNYANCPIVSKYSVYANYPNDYYCYVIKSSVFYWQPWQIENLETKGEGRDSWNSWELKKAYRNAIGLFSRVPELSN